MGELFELIVSNFFIIAVIIGGIIARINQERKKHSENPTPVAKPIETYETYDQEEFDEVSLEPTSEERQEMYSGNTDLSETQIELKKRMKQMNNTSLGRHNAIPDSPIKKTNSTRRKVKTNISIKNNLTKKRLAESIVMAEVLGAPRSLKRHESKFNKR